MRKFHGLSLFILILFGVYLGSLGFEVTVLVLTPLFLLWFMTWDERRYRQFVNKKQQQDRYIYRNQH